MRVSWNTLSEWVDLASIVSKEAAAELLTRRGLEVESLEHLDAGLEQVIVAEILSMDRHPQADRLRLCQVGIGLETPLQIVCGAQNMEVGDHVALARVGAALPNGVKIKESQIRGVLSQGMLCSEAELGFQKESDGILILPRLSSVGMPLAQFLERTDSILSLKLTANRGDCLSHRGLAREMASALGQPCRPIEAAVDLDFSETHSSCPLQVSLDEGAGGLQFLGCWMEGVQVGPSPHWLVARLESLGIRSVNNIVDATQWVMLELGHPVHAYDAAQIQGKHIRVRQACQGEKLTLLDDRTLHLNGTECVVADAFGPIGLAGVMGGARTQVQSSTSRIFLECAEFVPSTIRKTATLHQVRTEASHRFERGIDPANLQNVMRRLVSWIVQWAGGAVQGGVVTQTIDPTRVALFRDPICFGLYELQDFLGFSRDSVHVSLEQVQMILESLGCRVQKDTKTWKVSPPSYRLDLVRREDFAEELARSVGYDQLPATLPRLSTPPESTRPAAAQWRLMEQAKDACVRAGLCETVHLGFTSTFWLKEFELEGNVSVLNPLSEEYTVMVPSLLPGLIQAAIENAHHHFGSEPLAIRLFECRPTFHKKNSSDPAFSLEALGNLETGIQERWKLSCVLSGPQRWGGLKQDWGALDFYDLKAVVESCLLELGVRGIRYLPVGFSETQKKGTIPLAHLFPLFHPGQTAEVWAGDTLLGILGLLHPQKAMSLKVRDSLWMAELDWEKVVLRSRGAFEVASFRRVPEFPSMERDFALLVPNEILSEKICQSALKFAKPLAKRVKIFDSYQGAQVPAGMTSIAVRVTFYDEGRNLTEGEVEILSTQIVAGWKKDLGIELRTG